MNRYALLCATAMCQLLALSPAQAETYYSADLALGGGFSTNPYQSAGQSVTAPSATISISPVMVVKESVSTFKLSGTAAHTEYLKRYKANDSASITASYDRRLSARTSMSAIAGFSTALTGSFDNFELQPAEPGTDPVLPPLVDDIGLNGLRQRRNSIRGSARLAHAPSARDQFSVEVTGMMSRYPNRATNAGLNEYDRYSVAGSYSRVLNDRLSVGASVSASRDNYLRNSFGDSSTVSPQATAQFRLNSRFTLSGSLGMSISKTTLLGGIKDTSRNLAGSLNACYKADRNNFCLTGNRSAMPSSFNGTRTQTSFGANYNQRIDARTTASGWVSYSRASQPFVLGSRALQSVNAGVSVSRRLSERMSAFVSAGFADTYQDITNRRATIQANAGLRLALGVLR